MRDLKLSQPVGHPYISLRDSQSMKQILSATMNTEQQCPFLLCLTSPDALQRDVKSQKKEMSNWKLGKSSQSPDFQEFGPIDTNVHTFSHSCASIVLAQTKFIQRHLRAGMQHGGFMQRFSDVGFQNNCRGQAGTRSQEVSRTHGQNASCTRAGVWSILLWIVFLRIMVLGKLRFSMEPDITQSFSTVKSPVTPNITAFFLNCNWDELESSSRRKWKGIFPLASFSKQPHNPVISRLPASFTKSPPLNQRTRNEIRAV